MLQGRLKISEYEAYWLTDFPLINRVQRKKIFLIIILSFEVVCTSYKTANKQALGKIGNFTVNRDHINKK